MNMNMNKPLECSRKVGGDYFILMGSKRATLTLDYFIKNFDFDDYYCFKTTNSQRVINKADFLNLGYSGYIFFRKDIYSKESIQEWIDWMYSIGGIQYLSKPTPPFPPTKVKIIK